MYAGILPYIMFDGTRAKRAHRNSTMHSSGLELDGGNYANINTARYYT